MNDNVTIRGQTTIGVLIPHGGSTTIDVDLFSDGPVADWELTGLDLFGGGAWLDFSFSKPSGNNGDVVQLTLTFKKMTMGGAPFAIVSQDAQQHKHFFLGHVNAQ